MVSFYHTWPKQKHMSKLSDDIMVKDITLTNSTGPIFEDSSLTSSSSSECKFSSACKIRGKSTHNTMQSISNLCRGLTILILLIITTIQRRFDINLRFKTEQENSKVLDATICTFRECCHEIDHSFKHTLISAGVNM